MSGTDRAGPPARPAPLLSLEGLSLDIGGQRILEDVDLAIDAGEIVGLIGESGSGKSMTAYSTLRLLPDAARLSGRIVFDGTDLATLTEAQLCGRRGRDIAMVFQEPRTALNPVQPIGAQVMETIRIHGRASRAEAAERARQVLDRVGLDAARFPLGRYPHQLSGGQRQRVVIAMAIALRPRLLIADEPTTALDVTTQAQILALLQRLAQEDGMSLLLITHDLAVVAGMASRIAIMRYGRIVESGPTREVFETLRHPYTRQLFEASSHQPARTARAGTKPLLAVHGLVREYETRRASLLAGAKTLRAVDQVSFVIHEGESLGLVGESGCGKSTLTRALLGLEPLQGGEVRLSGEKVVARGRVDRRVRRHMQVVFQDPYGSFDPRQRVATLITEPFHLLESPPRADARQAAIDKALTSVGMQPADAGKYIHEFSGGQRQRIAIARALIIEPALIILDEAVSALDVSIRAQILDLLADLSQRMGLAYLFISHDLGVVRAITDRVMVMRSGRIVEEGPTGAVFDAPRHEYTKSLIAATPRLAFD